MSEMPEGPTPEQQMYWLELTQLKTDACYVRDYCNYLGKWVTGLAALQKITSFGGIAAWSIWKQFALIWAGLLAASQLADALKDVFPFYKRRRALSLWSRSLNKLFVEAQRDWDDISSGQYTNAQIRKLSHKLRSRKQKAEARYIPNGLSRKVDIFDEAQIETTTFFKARYNLGQE